MSAARWTRARSSAAFILVWTLGVVVGWAIVGAVFGAVAALAFAVFGTTPTLLVVLVVAVSAACAGAVHHVRVGGGESR